jgi:hypothetical protein
VDIDTDPDCDNDSNYGRIHLNLTVLVLGEDRGSESSMYMFRTDSLKALQESLA